MDHPYGNIVAALSTFKSTSSHAGYPSHIIYCRPLYISHFIHHFHPSSSDIYLLAAGTPTSRAHTPAFVEFRVK